MKAYESEILQKTEHLILRDPFRNTVLDMGLTREKHMNNPKVLSDMLDMILTVGWHDCNEHYIFDHKERNPDNLIFLTLDGSGILELDGFSYKITPGMITIIPNNVSTTYYTNPEKGHWKFYWMQVRGVNISNVLRRLYRNNVYLIPLDSIEPYTDIFEDLLNSPLEGNKMFLYNSRKVSELLHLFVEECITRGIIISDNNNFVKNIILFIEQNYMHPINTDDIANHVFMSAEYTIRNFKKHTGYTPHSYLKMYRMMRACDLLSSTALPVKEIAGRVGYKSDSNFISEFKAQKGMTPNRFRKNTKK